MAGPKPAHRRLLIAGPVVALVSLLAAVLTTDAAGLPLRDPDHVAGRRLAMVLGLVAVLIVLDVLVRARIRSRTGRPTRAAIASVWRERWTLPRGVAVGSALISFYVTYLAYRNLKSVVPLIRPGDLFDQQLADLDRSLFGGHDPATLMHDLLGTGVGAHFMSGAYMLFFAFIPGTLAIARRVRPESAARSLLRDRAVDQLAARPRRATSSCPRWDPSTSSRRSSRTCPTTAVSQLQDLLLDQRLEFLRDPVAGTAQSIGAFSSLHVSFFFTAALAAHLLGLARPLRIGAWVLFGLTTAATIYLGWHYVVDDLAGVVIGATGDPPGPRPDGPGPADRAQAGRSRRLHRRDAGVARASPPGGPPWRARLVAFVTLVAALLATDEVGLPLRDPDHVAALYLALVGFGVLMLVGLDIVVRAAVPRGLAPSRAAMRRVRRERWTRRRGLAVGSALVGFYLTYMAYRNLKSVVPLLRPGELFDRQLAELDRSLFGGNDPAALLHTLLGTGVQTHVLSAAYVAFIVFLPLTIGLALVFSRDLQDGLFYTTAQSINWGLGAASYFLLPSLGPVYADPGAFAQPPRLRGHAPAGHPARPAARFPPRPGDRDSAEHRGLCLAPHLDELHRRGRGPSPGGWKTAEDRLVDLVRRDDGQHDLPGLALRPRRPRRRDPRRHGPCPGRRPQRRRSAQAASTAAGDPRGRDGWIERRRRTRDPARARSRNDPAARAGREDPAVAPRIASKGMLDGAELA